MARIPIRGLDLTKGLSLKSNYLGGPGFPRVENIKISSLGVLTPRGGWDNWDTPAQDYGQVLGLKRWYREDGGVNFLFVATTSGGTTPKVWHYNLYNKTVDDLGDITQSLDLKAPVLWVDCDSLLVILGEQSSGAPWSVRLKGQGTHGGIHVKQLGLEASTTSPQLSLSSSNQGLDTGAYKYCYTRCYGTRSNPLKYGESGPSPVSVASVNNTVQTPKAQVQIDIGENFSGTGAIYRYYIYRTLKDGDTFYRIGEISESGRQLFYDVLPDSAVDTSNVLPTLIGIPPNLRAGIWWQNRLWAWGTDGTLNISAAGYPDIMPATYRAIIGQQGYRGNGFAVIRDNLYGFKEDGIFLITGSVPNIGYKKIDDTKCYARCSLASLPDGIYFLGEKDPDGSGIFKFNGNSAIMISIPIQKLLKRNDPYFFKRAFGKKVGDEYWLSCIGTHIAYVNHPHPFNNLVICCDPRYNNPLGFWSTIPLQANAIEVFDGPYDSSEVFIVEADHQAGATGNFYRYNPYKLTAPATFYNNGVRSYSTNQILTSKLAWGPLVSPEGFIDPLVPQKLILTLKGYRGIPLLNYYNDNEFLKQGTLLSFENTYVDAVIPDASKYGVSTFGSGVWRDISFSNRYEFNLDVIQHQLAPVLELILNIGTVGLTPEIEAFEFLYTPTNREVKNGYRS